MLGLQPLLRGALIRALLCACVVFASSLAAGLTEAQNALRQNRSNAPELALQALADAPDGAIENLHMSLTLFSLGMFDDSARHLRRALAGDPEVLVRASTLRESISPIVVESRLDELASEVLGNRELCFLTGVLLLLDRNFQHAEVFLIRAEELAGTDATAARLLAGIRDKIVPPRILTRGERALRDAHPSDALRSFSFLACESPRDTRARLGMALALVLSDEPTLAANVLKTANLTKMNVPLNWLRSLKLGSSLAAKAHVQQRSDNLSRESYTVASIAFFTSGYYASARETCITLLQDDPLHPLAHAMMEYLERHDLIDDPAPIKTPAPDDKPKPVEPTVDPITAAKGALADAKWHEAIKALDPLIVPDKTPNEVFFMAFVASVGTHQFGTASDALQAWYLTRDTSNAPPTGSIHKLIGDHLPGWLAALDSAIENAPDKAELRLLKGFVLLNTDDVRSSIRELEAAATGMSENFAAQGLLKIARSRLPKLTPAELHQMAQDEFLAGEYSTAEAHLLKALEASPETSGILLDLVRVRFALGKFREAGSTFAEWYARGDAAPNIPSFSDAYSDERLFEKHLSVLRQYCKDNELAASAWLLLGVVDYSEGKFSRAAKSLQAWRDTERAELSSRIVKLLDSAKAKTD